MTTTTNPTTDTMTMTDTIAERPTQEQIDRWPSCRIIAIMHDLEVALDAVDSTQARIQLRQACTMAGRAMVAQVDAESVDGRRLDLEEEAEV